MTGRGSIRHNNRSFSAANVDRSRSGQNITFCNEDLKKVYHELFDEALAAYNAKKKKTRDKIPDYYEHIRQSMRDYSDFTAAAHAKGALVTVAADLLSLALMKAPGEWGADIAVGSAQRLGNPMGFGGPAAGYLTTREAFKRNMPGRIIGVSVDRLGNRALRMALQMREQHIKREKATSNICTASALMASMTGFYCVYNGPEGLKRAAETAHLAAATVARALEAMDYKLTSKEFFDTLEVEAEAAVVQSLALENGINFYYPSEGRVRMSFDEVTTPAEIEAVAGIFAAAKGKKAKAVKAVTESNVPTALRRKSPYLQEPVFSAYRSESALMRYIKKLELRDISLANSMISLGSCTMKLNAAALMQPLSLAGFQNIHPFAPADQAKGYMDLIAGLEQDLATITGFAACSLQPNSGAAGEYAGLMVIRAYHQSRGQGYRNVVLIPASAHGTNPASAAMAGMKIVTVACDANGNIDVEDLEAKAKEYSSELCGLMVTYPSTHGVFESRIREIVDAVHDVLSNLYYRIGMGLFTNQEETYFVDFVNFRKSNLPEGWNDEIGGVFQALNGRWYNASPYYVRGHISYEAPFLVLRHLIKYTNHVQNERLYLNMLTMDHLGPYFELGYGIGTFVFDMGLFLSLENFKQIGFGYKITFELFSK